MKKFNILKHTIIVCFLILNISFFSSAQNVGDYQSVANGNWNSIATWQKCTTAGVWSAATIAPPTSYTSGTIYIQAGTNVTITSGISESFITINGGTLTVASTITLTIPNGANANDLIISSGNLQNNGTVSLASLAYISNGGTITNSSTLTINGTLINNLNLDINSNAGISGTGTITNNGTTIISTGVTMTNGGAVSNNGTLTINGTLLQNNALTNASAGIIQNNGTFTIATAKTFTNNGLFNNNSGSTLNVNTVNTSTGKINNSGTISNAGTIKNIATTASCILNNSGSTIINSGTITNTTAASMKFSAGSLYQHNYSNSLPLPTSGYILPYAIWDPASTCEILGFGDGTILPTSATIPSTISFGNIIWNCVSQPANINLNGTLKTSTGSFTLQSTNGFYLILKTTTGNNLTVSGSFNINGSAKLALTNGGTNFGTSSCILTSGSFNISGGILDLTQSVFSSGTGGNGTLNINGSFVHSGGIITKSGTQTATVNLTGSSLQSIESIGFTTGNAITFNTQTISAGNSVISSGKIFVVNQGTIFNVKENTASAGIDLTVDGTLQVSGQMYILSNGSIAMGTIPMTDAASGAGSFIMNTASTLLTKHPEGLSASASSGSIQVSGTRNFPADANYTFNGTLAQNTGDGLPDALTGILTLNNSSALSTAGVSLSRATTISPGGTLQLSAGRLITTSSSLITVDTGTTVVPNGGSALSFVDGPIKKIGFTAGTEFVFPTGDTAKWARIGFTASSTNDTLQYTAEYFKRDPHTNVDPSFIDSTLDRPNIKTLSYREYWYLNCSSGTTNGKVKLYWEDASFSGISSINVADLRIVHFKAAGPKWYAEGTAPLITSGTIQTQAAVTTFSSTYPYFTFGAPNTVNPLPIELISFTGNKTDAGNLLSWTTATETNNDRFELERGMNSYSFENIGTIDGNGNSTSILNYKFLDETPLNGLNYYRLKQRDYDGKYSYSNIISIDNTRDEQSFVKAYPNPTTEDYINLSLSENISSLSIFNLLGEEIFYRENIGSGSFIVDHLSKGVYIIKAISAGNNIITTRFIKQ